MASATGRHRPVVSAKGLGERHAPFAGIALGQQVHARSGQRSAHQKAQEHALLIGWHRHRCALDGDRSTPASATTRRALTAICPAQTRPVKPGRSIAQRSGWRGARRPSSSRHEFVAVGQRTGHGNWRAIGGHDHQRDREHRGRQRGVARRPARLDLPCEHPRQRALHRQRRRAGERIGNLAPCRPRSALQPSRHGARSPASPESRPVPQRARPKQGRSTGWPGTHKSGRRAGQEDGTAAAIACGRF